MGLALDEPKEEDIVEVINGIQVAVEKNILAFTENLTLDYKQTSQGFGFVMTGNHDCCLT